MAEGSSEATNQRIGDQKAAGKKPEGETACSERRAAEHADGRGRKCSWVGSTYALAAPAHALLRWGAPQLYVPTVQYVP